VPRRLANQFKKKKKKTCYKKLEKKGVIFSP